MDHQQPAGSPGAASRCPMHGADFAADPHLVYDQLRAQARRRPWR